MIFDKILIEVDKGLKTLTVKPLGIRSRPDVNISETKSMSSELKKTNSKFMRVNHAGEVCAQGLYRGHLFFNKNTKVKKELEVAADEEIDHLSWCDERIKELGGKTSILNPVLYSGSFFMGAFTSIIDNKYNLGFLAETEKQVSAHLSDHLKRIDNDDKKTIKIIEAMKSDEEAHANLAKKMGGKILPSTAKKIMRYASKLMTKTTFYL